MSEQFADVLGRKYLLALTTVAVLVLGNQALVQPFLMRLTIDAPLINIAGRQRMLSQRLAKAALACGGDWRDGASAYLDEMREVLSQWSSAHEQLLVDSSRSTWGATGSPVVRAGLDGLQPQFEHICDAAQRVIRAAEDRQIDPTTVEHELGVILAHESDYLRQMDAVVGMIEREARDRVENLRRVGWLVAGLTLAVLAAIGLFILRPATLLIRRQVLDLRRARDELEERVSARTQELEAARERHRTMLEEFSHVGRTSTIGEMASALAHELNQPLGAIANYAEGCLIELDSPQPSLGEIRGALKGLLGATMRSGRIIKQVRRFVSRQGLIPERFDPNDTVGEVLEILGGQTRERGVAIACDLAPGLPSLLGDPVQIQQVLVNLVRNALDAIPESQTQSPKVVISTRQAGPGTVEFAVTDKGEGIPTDRLERVFDAYFSTRAGGMGMGLAICRTIVEAHHGRIVVESDPGIQTTFRFFLPAAPSDHD
jgi:signal transduction histidine kinase